MKQNQAYRLFNEIEEKKRCDGEIWPMVRTEEIRELYCGLERTMIAELHEAARDGKIQRYGSGKEEFWRS